MKNIPSPMIVIGAGITVAIFQALTSPPSARLVMLVSGLVVTAILGVGYLLWYRRKTRGGGGV